MTVMTELEILKYGSQQSRHELSTQELT